MHDELFEQLITLDPAATAKRAQCKYLPDTGCFFVFLPVKFEASSGGPGRAVAITEGSLAKKLISAVSRQHVVDLSVVNGPDFPTTWPGAITAILLERRSHPGPRPLRASWP